MGRRGRRDGGLEARGGFKQVSTSFRIAIVGSGPAGLSAAARAAQLGISHVLLEKTDHLSDTIYKYQKGKHVMATPSQLVLRSDMDFEAGKREAVLGTWDKMAAEHKINVKAHGARSRALDLGVARFDGVLPHRNRRIGTRRPQRRRARRRAWAVPRSA